MKVFYKSRYSLVLILVLSLVMQIAAPVAGNFAYAEETEEAFKVDTIMNEDGTVNVNWEYEYIPGGEMKDELELDITLEEGQSGDLVEDADKVSIGKYKISNEGELTLEVDETLVEKILEKLEVKDDEPIEPESIESLTPLIPATPIDEETDDDEKDETEDVDDVQESNDDNEIPSTDEDDDLLDTETESNKENEDTDSVRKIDNLLGLFSRNEVYAAGEDGETIEAYTFRGSFDVEGVVEEGNFVSVMSGKSDGKPLSSEEINLKNLEFKMIENDDGIEEIDDEYILNLGIDKLTARFSMSFGFSLEGGHDINSGDYYEFTMPTAFKLDTVEDEKIKSGDEVIAKYNINSDGKVRITFEDVIRSENDIGQPVDNGKFEAVWGLGEIVKSGELEQEYKFNLNGEKTFKIVIKNNIGKSISKKEGIHEKNAPTVKWSVDVNKSTENIGGKTLTDSMSGNIKEGSIKVYKLIPKIKDGKIIFEKSDSETTEGFSLKDNKNFPIEFIGESNNNAYLIEYETIITAEEREAYYNGRNELINEVTLSDTPKGSDKSKVTLNFDKPITKSVNNSKHGEIDWKIIINSDKRDISGEVIIQDTLNFGNAKSADEEFMEFVKEGGKVKVNISPEPKSISTKLSDSGKTLEIRFTPKDDKKPQNIQLPTRQEMK